MLATAIKEWGTLIDLKDKLQNIHDPASEYTKSAMMDIGRQVDNTVIASALGLAYGGETGATAVPLTHTQRVASVSSSAIAVPNVAFLRKTKRRFMENKVKGKVIIAYAADFLDALLGTTEVGSADYNSVKALVDGTLDTFMGFKFVHCEEVGNSAYLADTIDNAAQASGGTEFKYNTSTGLYDASGTALGATDRTAVAFVDNSAVILGENTGGRKSEVGPRPDKRYDQQIYVCRDMGATRIEEVQVVHMIYKAS